MMMKINDWLRIDWLTIVVLVALIPFVIWIDIPDRVTIWLLLGLIFVDRLESFIRKRKAIEHARKSARQFEYMFGPIEYEYRRIDRVILKGKDGENLVSVTFDD